ncbi:type II toxin-antitoxin system PemK/MazF family toxin [candidate division KSB1 bacterium]|nr:type II toxin-antitoxin system PemK/MazF family toxin [bacterium]NUM68485.1 type II toxin-antitoxin system PemK/MazF family toxin [candidate division KSB1 bacterium]
MITEWSDKKGQIITNVVIEPDSTNGLSKKSGVDCLQTRPVDHRHRLVKIRGKLDDAALRRIDQALKMIFDLG